MATETPTTATTAPAGDAYLDLVRAFPLRPIRSDEEHDRAIATLYALSDRKHTLGPEEMDYFLILAMIVERHESEIYDGLKPGDAAE